MHRLTRCFSAMLPERSDADCLLHEIHPVALCACDVKRDSERWKGTARRQRARRASQLDRGFISFCSSTFINPALFHVPTRLRPLTPIYDPVHDVATTDTPWRRGAIYTTLHHRRSRPIPFRPDPNATTNRSQPNIIIHQPWLIEPRGRSSTPCRLLTLS